jgi:hypothetical protein
MGYGEAIVGPVFELGDPNGICCYLEAPAADNARFYGRRGFAVMGETTVPGSDVHVWLMRREPRAI